MSSLHMEGTLDEVFEKFVKHLYEEGAPFEELVATLAKAVVCTFYAGVSQMPVMDQDTGFAFLIEDMKEMLAEVQAHDEDKQ